MRAHACSWFSSSPQQEMNPFEMIFPDRTQKKKKTVERCSSTTPEGAAGKGEGQSSNQNARSQLPSSQDTGQLSLLRGDVALVTTWGFRKQFNLQLLGKIWMKLPFEKKWEPFWDFWDETQPSNHLASFTPPSAPRNEEVEKMMVVVGEESEKTAKARSAPPCDRARARVQGDGWRGRARACVRVFVPLLLLWRLDSRDALPICTRVLAL